MKELKNTTPKELSNIVNNKNTISIELPKSFNLKITKDKTEIAPSISIQEPKSILDISRLKLDNDENKFNYLIARIYNNNGIILYSNLNNGNFKAEIDWQ